MLKDKLNYQPNELAFGTSGLRGLLSDMTDLECYINAIGFVDFLLDSTDGGINTVFLAGDLRSSTPRIMRVMARAIEDRGLRYVNCGYIPTPAVAYFAGLKSQPCIMVTGSHIPDDRNGIKFYKPNGEVLKSDEAAIKVAVDKARKELYNSQSDMFDENGKIINLKELSNIDNAAANSYKDRYLDFFASDSLAGNKIVMYQQSAVGRDLIPEVLEGLGAQVELVARSEKFIPIDTENVTKKDEDLFAQFAAQFPGCSAIISTDGDSDRPFVIDESGAFHRGDELGLVVSEYLGAEAVAIPISSNDACRQALEDRKVELVYTKIGSPHVIVAMDELAKSHQLVAGWEVNGGYLLGSDINIGSKSLKSLKTRDALLPIICALLSAKSKKMKLSEVFNQLPRRYTQAGLIDNFASSVSAKIIEKLSGDETTAKSIINQVFTNHDGFDEVIEINTIDGVRIVFNNGDVAHLRPSGNAPQLRIYSNADSQVRADQIASLAIAEPDGIFRRLESIIS